MAENAGRIEKAINSFEIFAKTPSHDLRESEIDLAIKALKEKLEREQGCKFCLDKDVFMYEAVSYSYFEPLRRIGNVDFKFCPMCGRKLKADAGNTHIPSSDINPDYADLHDKFIGRKRGQNDG